MSFISKKCPHCGANIEIDDAKKKGKCPYCNTSFINEEPERNNATKVLAAEKALSKKKIKPAHLIIIFIIFLVQVGIVAFFIVDGKKPLDEILLYKVNTVILEDGKMENTYYIEWKVLNDTKDGALTWIQIGMPNSNFIIKDFGRDVANAYPYSESSIIEEWVRCDLKYIYYKGQTAKIEFTVIQFDMLCYDSGKYFYEFIPGWFDEKKVNEYEFNWMKDERILSNNSDAETESALTWKGSFKNSGYRVINVEYSSKYFSEDQTVSYIPFVKPASAGVSFNPGGLGIFLLFTAFVLIFVQIGIIAGAVSYYRGRGFIFFGGYYRGGGGSGRSGGSGGGGCACACAGCACACACAGGGRAGCSLKDFYSTKEDEKVNIDEPSL